MSRFHESGLVAMVSVHYRAGMACILGVLLAACSSSHTVGIIAGMTGPPAELGIAGRNGIIFRFEEENSRRGMNRFVLTIEDDQNNPARVPGIIDRFQKAGVSVVIGPFTSTIALSVIDQQPTILFVSPTASAKRLSGLDDMLICLMASIEAAAHDLGREMRERYQLDSVAVVWDINNRIYAEDYLEAFTLGWGSAIKGALSGNPPSSQKRGLYGRGFDSNSNEDLLSAAKFLAESEADSVLIIASGANTASIIRILRREAYDRLIIVSGWAVTSDLSVWGVETLEGVVFSQQYDPAFDGSRFLEFKKNYRERFGTDPSFGAIFGYEAADLIIRVLKTGQRQNPLRIKRDILALDPFEALQGKLILDSFGDPERNSFLFQFRSGQPVRLP